MLTKLTLLGAGLGVVLATPVSTSAQEAATVQSPRAVQHAEIGKLESYDGGAGFIVVGLPSHMTPRVHTDYEPLPVSRNYRIDEHTRVSGVDPMAAGTARGLSGQEGGVVLVKYTYAEGRLYSPWLFYVGAGQVREADGSVVRTNASKREIVVRNTAGVQETIELQEHGLVDSPSGLVTLASLHTGQNVRIFYVKRGSANIGYLIRQMG